MKLNGNEVATLIILGNSSAVLNVSMNENPVTPEFVSNSAPVALKLTPKAAERALRSLEKKGYVTFRDTVTKTLTKRLKSGWLCQKEEKVPVFAGNDAAQEMYNLVLQVSKEG